MATATQQSLTTKPVASLTAPKLAPQAAGAGVGSAAVSAATGTGRLQSAVKPPAGFSAAFNSVTKPAPPPELPTPQTSLGGRSLMSLQPPAGTQMPPVPQMPRPQHSTAPPAVNPHQGVNASPAVPPEQLKQQQLEYNQRMWRSQQRERDASPAPSVSQSASSLLNRFLGFERADPRTGKMVHTTPSELGRDHKGGPGAVAAGLAGIPTMAASLPFLLKGDTGPLAAAARDTVAPINHWLGTDIGHNWKPDAAMSSAYEPADPALRESFTLSKSSPTTPGVFSSPYDPLTGVHKPSIAGAAADMSRNYADDQTNGANKLQRILAGAHSTAASNAGNAISALTPARLLKGLGAPALLANPMTTGAVTQGGAAAADPAFEGTTAQRGISTLGNGLQGAFSTLSANPLMSLPQEAAKQFGAQDIANTAGKYIRDTLGKPTTNILQRTLAHGAAGAVEGAPTALSAIMTGGPGLLRGSRDALQKGLGTVKAYTAANAAAAGTQGAMNAVPPTSDKPVLEQADSGVTDTLWNMHDREQQANPASSNDTGAMSELVRRQPAQNPAAAATIATNQAAQAGLPSTTQGGAGAAAAAKPAAPGIAPSATTGYTTPLDVLPPEQSSAVQTYAQTSPEIATKMQDATAVTLTAAAETPEGKANLESVKTTGELTPTGDAQAKYNLLKDGFNQEEIGKWYNQLSGVEKFALWGGASLTMLGLMQTMNDGGAGAWLTTLLGLGAVGLTAGQSGVLGETAQQGAQAITQPLGDMASAATTGIAEKVMQNPGAVKAMAPLLDRLPDNTITLLQQKIRTARPDLAKKMDLATMTIGGFSPQRDFAVRELSTEYGFSPEAAERWLTLWPSSQTSATVGK